MADGEKKVPADKAVEAAKEKVNAGATAPVPSSAHPSVKERAPVPAPTGSASAFSRPRAGEAETGKQPNKTADDPARTVAVAKFSLVDLQNIYAALRDGDYYSAFKYSISFLHDLFNAPKEVPVVRRGNPGIRKPIGVAREGTPVNVAEMGEIDRTIALMESQLEVASNADFEEPKAMSNTKRAAMASVNIMDVLAIIRVVMDFISEWRKKQNVEQPEDE